MVRPQWSDNRRIFERPRSAGAFLVGSGQKAGGKRQAGHVSTGAASSSVTSQLDSRPYIYCTGEVLYAVDGTVGAGLVPQWERLWI